MIKVSFETKSLISSLLRPTAKNTHIASGFIRRGGRCFIRLRNQSFPLLTMGNPVLYFVLHCIISFGLFVVFEQVCYLHHASDGSGHFELNSYLPTSTTALFVVFIYQSSQEIKNT